MCALVCLWAHVLVCMHVCVVMYICVFLWKCVFLCVLTCWHMCMSLCLHVCCLHKISCSFFYVRSHVLYFCVSFSHIRAMLPSRNLVFVTWLIVQYFFSVWTSPLNVCVLEFTRVFPQSLIVYKLDEHFEKWFPCLHFWLFSHVNMGERVAFGHF